MFFKSRKGKPEVATVGVEETISAASAEARVDITGAVMDEAGSAATASDTLSAGAPAVDGAGPIGAAELTAEERARRGRVSKQLIGTFSEIVSLVMRTKVWRERPIRDLEELILPPLLSGQFSIAEAQSKANGLVSPVAVVLWARVSADVDQRLASQLDQPLRLAPAEWTSGDILWVVEAIGEPKVLREMLKRLAAKDWAGKAVKMRAKGKDGLAAVAVLGKGTEA